MRTQRIILAAVFFGLAAGCTSTNAMSELELVLTVDGSTFVESESIPFVVRLRNAGPDPATLVDFTPDHESVTLVAAASDGTERMGTQMSWSKRDGNPFHEPRSLSTFTIDAGGEEALSGDGVAWLGVLPAGTYELYAAYSSGAAVYEESPRVPIVIESAEVSVYAPAASPSQPAFAPTLSAWVHDEGRGHRLFLLQSSANFPPNFIRNRRGPQVAPEVPVEAATIVMERVPARHAVWIDGDGTLQVVRIGEDGVPADPVRFNLNAADSFILRSPLSDADGNLHLVVSPRSPGSILHIRVSAAGEISRQTIGEGPVDSTAYAVLWGRSGSGHLVWKPRHGRVLQHARFDLADMRKPAATEAIDVLPGTPAFVMLREIYEDDAFHLKAHVLERDVPETGGFRQWTIAIDPIRPGVPEPLIAPPSGDGRPVSGALTAEDRAVYLFADSTGAIFLVGPNEPGALPVIASGGEPLRVERQPALHATTAVSRKPGLYVGYRPEHGPIEFVKVK